MFCLTLFKYLLINFKDMLKQDKFSINVAKIIHCTYISTAERELAVDHKCLL